jgi:hypothetical protein
MENAPNVGSKFQLQRGDVGLYTIKHIDNFYPISKGPVKREMLDGSRQD